MRAAAAFCFRQRTDRIGANARDMRLEHTSCAASRLATPVRSGTHRSAETREQRRNISQQQRRDASVCALLIFVTNHSINI